MDAFKSDALPFTVNSDLGEISSGEESRLVNPPEDSDEITPGRSPINLKEINLNEILLQYVKTFIPSLIYWVPQYNRQKLRGDLIAGITVGVVLIPQGMAYGLLAGLPPIYGLYAGVIAPLIYSIFGTSMQLSVGPVAITALLTASGVRNLEPQSDAEYIQAAILLGFVSGIILIIMGFLRVGFVMDFLSNTVLSGFISASACIIVVSQLKEVFGVKASGETTLDELISVLKNMNQFNGYAFVGSILCIALLFGVKKVKKIPKWIPTELILMLVTIFISWVAGLDSKIRTVGFVPSGMPPPSLPALTRFPLSDVIYQSFIIALISYIGTIALARAFAFQHGYEIDPNKELIAQGASNFLGAFFSGHPVSGSFSRTAINNEMGAKSPLAAIITAAVVAICLLLLTPIFEYLPKLVLASIVILSVRSLLDYKEAIYLWKVNKIEFVVLLATFLCTLFIGIDTGIIASIVISLAIVLFRTSRPNMIILGRMSNSILYRDIRRHPKATTFRGIVIMRMEADLYFANITRFKQRIYKMLTEDITLHTIIVDATSINYVDPSALHILSNMLDDLKKKKITLAFANAHGAVRDMFEVSGIAAKMGLPSKIHIHQAVQHFRKLSEVAASRNSSEDTTTKAPSTVELDAV